MENDQEQNTDSCCYRIKVVHSSETHLAKFSKDDPLIRGDMLIVDSRYGKDLAVVLGNSCCCERSDDKAEMITIVRRAGDADLKRHESNLEREREALRICREKVDSRELDMKLVSAHYLDEESKLLFFFTAEARVDFRELVKDLVAVFKTRIELRQIGVRDEARVLGGIGVCGRVLCCNGITDKLNPVSIKMAKEQNLSLNSMKISGPCGRLLCCLSYEYEFYREEKRSFPPEGARIPFNGLTYKVSEVNVLSKTVKLHSSEGGVTDVSVTNFERDAESRKWKILRIDEE
ncbi:regulatory iron-sulfur-containing complex subunit RicT [Marispirochaeta sp.]|jgi:cell fate regulator YaaT (PSP1 superfamily)|uniref:PSP1 domain-containing protein n=1 Tax=Marispirochaeta sp. TaxID=2038653 RepID=UPI0029C89D87|nr:regulatory iron-sulfur-containing complex subunit RicT [Marispirochaeta sp.]